MADLARLTGRSTGSFADGRGEVTASGWPPPPGASGAAGNVPGQQPGTWPPGPGPEGGAWGPRAPSPATPSSPAPSGSGWGSGATSAGFGASGSGWGSGGPGAAPSSWPRGPGSAAPAPGGTATTQWSAGGAGPAGWGSATEAGDPAKARPPLGWLWGALAGPLAGALLLFLHGWKWNALGWALAVLVGFGLLVVFTTVDLRRRASPWYLSQPGLVAGLRLSVAGAALLVAGIHAYLLADYIARLDVWVR